jgi:hypothetical protein
MGASSRLTWYLIPTTTRTVNVSMSGPTWDGSVIRLEPVRMEDSQTEGRIARSAMFQDQNLPREPNSSNVFCNSGSIARLSS